MIKANQLIYLLHFLGWSKNMMINQVKDKFLQKNIKRKGLRIPWLVDVSVSSAVGKLRQRLP